MDRRCGNCGGTMVTVRTDAMYCTTRCRVAGNRKKRSKAASFPSELVEKRRFVRAAGKVPLQTTGRSASSTNPSTWASFDEVMASTEGDGFGVMLGDGLGCYDFDNVSDEEARGLVALIPERIIYTERSLSGKGVHVFVEAPEGPGTKKWQGQHERYTSSRFIRMTGNRFEMK